MTTNNPIASRARWVQNSATTLILKCRVKDGGAVLATIRKHHHFLFVWELEHDNSIGGHVQTRYTAMRRVRAALRDGE